MSALRKKVVTLHAYSPTDKEDMETVQLRAELFREMNPMLDNDKMLRKMLFLVRSLLTEQQAEAKTQKAKGYKVKPVSPDIEKWSGCASFSEAEIASDPRLKAILDR